MSKIRVGTAVVGLIPAAGFARRLPGLPCSKEILPLGYDFTAVSRGTVRVPMSYLLRGFREAGIGHAFVGIRSGKWDIPAFFGDGAGEGVQLAYLPLIESASVTETVSRLLPIAGDRICAFGFPDILFSPTNAFRRLLQALEQSADDLVLGLFPTDRPEKSDMVAIDSEGRVTDIVIKRPGSGLATTWALAVWTPEFGRRIAESPPCADEVDAELHLGHVFLRELRRGARVSAVRFSNGRVLDIGTPDDLARASSFPLPDC